ncbi:amidase [Rhizobium sp.]|jgi:aspartyl-tRNA(Asn)/glutamyl-tRNA(Gln) amidotransferase subunit A|uniref:amidase n=1 Tax=Rhizobium sp. TaxID=391 RepID=UPI000E8CA555|nr:amidase [Rhizobium sp.]
MYETLLQRADTLASGQTTSEQMVRDALDRINEPTGEGSRTFVKVHSFAALAAAKAYDSLRKAGLSPTPFAGIPISVKDLFDLEGEPTPAGSKVLSHAAPATADAPAIARLRAAGFVVIGRSNMTEFAFSGLGLNPHYDTPANPYDRDTRRIPGGSSSGAAVSVSDGMAAAGIGSDTGGSCRIPAALCGITGYKPTASTVPRIGVLPLSTTLDSIGSLANSVECCRILHMIMSGFDVTPALPSNLTGLRIGVPQTIALDDLEPYIAETFERTLRQLSKAGAVVTTITMQEFGEVPHLNAKGGFSAAEAYAWHRSFLDQHGDLYDQRVRSRILRGKEQLACDYVDLISARADFVRRANRAAQPFDVLAMPTVPMVAPAITALDGDNELFTRVNLAMLRNPTLINMMDGCSVSIPMHRQGDAPAGLMLSTIGGHDATLFSNASAIENALSAQ